MLGVAITFGVNVGIRLIRLKGESGEGCEVCRLSCMVITDDANFSM